MIRRSPCEQYIRFLLVHPDHYTTAMIREIVLTKGLDYIGDIYAKRLLSQMRIPDPFRPYNKLHGPSHIFLMREGLESLFFPGPSDLLAQQLLENAKAKETIETLSLAGERPEFISTCLERREGIRSTAEAIRRYFKYYWNLGLVDQTERRTLIRMRGEYNYVLGHDPDADESAQLAALKGARYKDPRRLIVESTVTPIAAMLNRMRLGMMPSQEELSRLAQASRVAATARTLESLLTDSHDSAAQARDYALVSKSMTELIADIGSPDAELQKELQKLQLATDHQEIPHIAELSAGNYTTDLNPREIVEGKLEEADAIRERQGRAPGSAG